MPTEPVAIIVAGKVENAEQLRRYWRDWRERNDRIRRGMFADLEAIEQVSSTAGSSPEPIVQPWAKEQWQYVQQLRAQVNYLNNKMLELRAEKKKGNSYEPF